MIRAEFYESNGVPSGFIISGHADYANSGHDIVCAAVSSAVQLSANIITEGFCKKADVSARGSTVECRILDEDKASASVLKMLKIHLEMLSEEFPKTIKITTLEV